MSLLRNFQSNYVYKVTYHFFYLICSSATLFFICYCLYQYSLNEDISQVTFKEFHQTEENIYPSLTLCFELEFNDDDLRKCGVTSSDDYTNYLTGNFWSDQMVNVDYDKVTLNIESYLLGFVMWTPDWTYIHGEEYFSYDHRSATYSIDNNSTDFYGWKPRFYISYRGHRQKCMSIDIPYMPRKKMWTFGAIFDRSIFPNSTRPDYYGFGVKMHYPGQLLRNQMQKYVWKERTFNTSTHVTMKFKIQKLEVIKHRKSAKQSCNKNWTKDDERMMLEKMQRVGCKPSYLKVDADFPICRSQREMKIFANFNSTHYQPPCKSIRKILYSYEEFNHLEDWTDGWPNETDRLFEVMVEFTDGTYMEIEQVQDYGPQDVVGDIGGYLGLFLGFALLQIPDMLFTFVAWVDDIIYKKSKKVEPEIDRIQGNDYKCSHGQCFRQCMVEIDAIKHDLEEIRSNLIQCSLELELIKT